MITAINTAVEYKDQIEFYPFPELTQHLDPIFAHSMDEALAWVKASPFYKDAEIVIDGDRATVTSQWIENKYNSILFGHEDATHVRHQIRIYPVNTAFISHRGYHG